MTPGRAPGLACNLAPARDVEGSGRTFTARSTLPWLKLDIDARSLAGLWIRVTYVAGFFDPLTRPVIRFWQDGSFYDDLLPGALLGRGVWLGRAPAGTTGIWISPVDREGPFSFEIETIEIVPMTRIIRECLRRNPGRCAVALLAKLIHLEDASYKEFRSVLGPTALAEYDEWRKERMRTLDPAAFDIPRFAWSECPHIRIAARLRRSDIGALGGFLDQLRAQLYHDWSLTLLCAEDLWSAPPDALAGLSSANVFVRKEDARLDSLAEFPDDDLFTPVSVHDELPSHSLACLAQGARAAPGSDVFYGDQEIVSGASARALRLLPDWSPLFCARAPYIHGSASIRLRTLRSHLEGSLRLAEAFEPEFISTLAVANGLRAEHVRRILRARHANKIAPGDASPRPAAAAAEDLSSAGNVSTTIIIPTRDRKLLEVCLSSLEAFTAVRDLEIIVVSNADDPISLDRFGRASFARVKTLHRPGPFNFSKLCNDAARVAQGSVLLFLNDDAEAFHSRWLEPLVAFATRAEIGAVGAKLIYGNKRIQHGGVVLGTRGSCGHFELRLPCDDPGYFERLCVTHEVSAVTGACLTVEKAKFDRVGGFDESNLPVDLNDVDLCLRLTDAGWKSVMLPQSILYHHESRSRGKRLRAEEIYASERRYFRTRWMSVLRNDPYFHPALSLDSLSATLG